MSAPTCADGLWNVPLKRCPPCTPFRSGSSKISLHFCKDLLRKTQELLLLLHGSFCEHPSPWAGPTMMGLCSVGCIVQAVNIDLGSDEIFAVTIGIVNVL